MMKQTFSIIILFIATIIFFASCCKNDMNYQQLAGTYVAQTDFSFGNKYELHEDGTVTIDCGFSESTEYFTKSGCRLEFSTGTAWLNSDGTEFYFSTSIEVDNPDYINDSDGYDDLSGEEIPRYKTETQRHCYSR
jgi:hypothetical protein